MTVSRQAGLVKDVTQVAHAAKLGLAEVLDARGPGRFGHRGPRTPPRPARGPHPGLAQYPFRRRF
jgi:thiosulfate/3-mercaptopyruvate sulfurtransferase